MQSVCPLSWCLRAKMLDVLVSTREHIIENWLLFFRSLFFLILDPSFPIKFPRLFSPKNSGVMAIMIESSCTQDPLWLPHLWNYPRPGWMGLESTLSKGRCLCPWQGCWKEGSLPIQTTPWLCDLVLAGYMTDRRAGETSHGLKCHCVCSAVIVRETLHPVGHFWPLRWANNSWRTELSI